MNAVFRIPLRLAYQSVVRRYSESAMLADCPIPASSEKLAYSLRSQTKATKLSFQLLTLFGFEDVD